MPNELIGFMVFMGLLVAGGVALTRRRKNQVVAVLPASEDSPAVGSSQPQGRIFLTLTFDGINLQNVKFENSDLSVEDARALVLDGVITGPEFHDTEDPYRANYFRQRIIETLGVEGSTAKEVIRPWEAGMESRIGDRVIYAILDRSTRDVTFRLLTIVPSNFIG